MISIPPSPETLAQLSSLYVTALRTQATDEIHVQHARRQALRDALARNQDLHLLQRHWRRISKSRLLAAPARRWVTKRLSRLGLFDAREYLAANPDVLQSGQPALDHLILYGLDERRRLSGPDNYLCLDEQARIVAESDLFDQEWIEDKYGGLSDVVPDAAYFYVLVGAKLGMDPGPNFSTIGYLADNEDVFQKDLNPLVHYCLAGATEHRRRRPSALNRGSYPLPEKRSAEPDAPGKPHGMGIDSEVAYAANMLMRQGRWNDAINMWRLLIYSTTPTVGHFTSLSHCYRRLNRNEEAQLLMQEAAERLPNSPDIAFEIAQVISASGDHRRAFEQWLSLGATGIMRNPHVAMVRIAAAASGLHQERDWWPQDISRLRDRVPWFDPPSLGWMLLGVVGLRTRDWELAEESWGIVRNSEAGICAHRLNPVSLFVRDRDAPSDFVQAKRHLLTNASQNERLVVYTAIFGAYDRLQPPLYAPDGVDFICFSDREILCPGWRNVVLDDVYTDPFLANRAIKINARDYLPNYSASIYIDGNMLVTGDVARLWQTYGSGADFLAWEHAERRDVFDEIEAILTNHRAAPAPMIAQAREFAERGLQSNTGLIEANVLVRWHDPRSPLWLLMKAWWEILLRHHEARRDQPALGYLMATMTPRPQVFPRIHGDSRHSDFFVKLAHANSFSAGPLRRRPSPEQREVVWLRRENQGSVASTVMRGLQLSQLAGARLPDRTVRYVSETAIPELSDSIVILTKGFLKRATENELEVLARNGNVLCADYVDDTLRDELNHLIDVYVTSSIRQHVYCANRMPEKIWHYVTHHTDPRITSPRDLPVSLRIGYFGEIRNARHCGELEDLVTFHGINTKRCCDSDLDWIAALSSFRAHYGVREHRDIDGFKPFLKGFTAAVSGAVLVTELVESDARYYLGADYPYLVPDGTLQGVRDTLELVRDSFGTATWRHAEEIMRSVRDRCSTRQIAWELRSLLKIIDREK